MAKKKKKEPESWAVACLKHSEGITYCGNTYYTSKEFVFLDADHAMKHYAKVDPKNLQVCQDCALIYRKRNPNAAR